ncbi:Oidioi.mRNA.OKI2018_I69.XSR.g16006.t1.cds [Oikopleura dioica]|uniref:Oidioi.mRNA.OKI2018_I69.XSR.g16006.t1.cds n=1 Tax=Oikopleura dioica TaxID=34765 RepID=A0ABN7SJM9_OIKDI|nr:Oidioi.mRNA.OKI2018_I69.XSR.g16006.t1.cds [Oikopleura dioica]
MERNLHKFELVLILVAISAVVLEFYVIREPFWSAESVAERVIETEKTYKGLWSTCLYIGSYRYSCDSRPRSLLTPGNWHVLWCRISTTFGAIFGILSTGGIFISADLVEFYKGNVRYTDHHKKRGSVTLVPPYYDFGGCIVISWLVFILMAFVGIGSIMKQRYVQSNRYCVKFESDGPATYQTRATKSFTNPSFTISSEYI